MNRAKQVLKTLIPPRHHDAVRLYGYRSLNFGFRRYCPCCGSSLREFRPYGVKPRPRARCPVCGALERHRLVSLFLRSHADLLSGARRVLHIAPEPPMERFFKGEVEDYVSLDLGERDAMLQADLTRTPFSEFAFDGIYCSHVLEHIPEDVHAISEMRRVLRPGGWAIIQVPIQRDVTFEDPSVTDPDQRRRLFGQPDHVRIYGRDFRDRLEEAGFSVTVEHPCSGIANDIVERCGLTSQDDIFLCRRPIPSPMTHETLGHVATRST